jgi:hypothetical protein
MVLSMRAFGLGTLATRCREVNHDRAGRRAFEIADAGGVRVVAVTKHGDIDQVRRRRIFPDLAIDATQVDLFVEPTANPVVASVGNKVWETADVFVLPRFQPIASDHLHRALLATIRRELKKQSRRVIVAFSRAFVEGTADRQLDVPPPCQHRVSGEVDIDMGYSTWSSSLADPLFWYRQTRSRGCSKRSSRRLGAGA